MADKLITYSIKDFRQGISPDLYKSGIARTEHFDTIAGQARQWHNIAAATMGAYGSSNTGNKLNSYTKVGSIIYALGFDTGTSHPAIFYWDYNTQTWLGLATFATGSTAYGLFNYQGVLYGYYNGTHIFKCTTAGVASPTHYDITDFTTFAPPIVHSKDATAYLFLDNLVYTFNGTTATLALTLPTGFKITNACEDGDYILIVGYDTDGRATGYLWDRDSSLSTTTAKYDLGYDTPCYVAKLGGTAFFVSFRGDSTNASSFTDQSVLTVRVKNGDRADILAEYQMPTLYMPQLGTHFGMGSFATTHRLYFNAYAQLQRDSAAKNLTFRLDYDGKLSIALNLGINSQTNVPCNMLGLYRESDMWFIAGTTDGNWITSTAHSTVSAIESTVLRHDDLSMNLKHEEAMVTYEALPSGGSVAVQARKNGDTSWTTLKTDTTTGNMKMKVTPIEAVNALNGLDSAKQVQYRVQVSCSGTSPVILTGFQVILSPTKDPNNG